jgi:hypothetical protein
VLIGVKRGNFSRRVLRTSHFRLLKPESTIINIQQFVSSVDQLHDQSLILQSQFSRLHYPTEAQGSSE